MRKDKCHLKKKLKHIKQRRKLDLLHGHFAAWKGDHRRVQDESASNYENMLQCKALHIAARLHALLKHLKKEITESKQRALRQTIDEFKIDTPAAEVLRQLKGFIGPTNPRSCQSFEMNKEKSANFQVMQWQCGSDFSSTWRGESACHITDCAINGLKS